MKARVRGAFAAIAFLLLWGLPRVVRSDSMDDAEAKRRGVAVEVVEVEHLRKSNADLQAEASKMRAQISELKKQISDLKAGLAAAPASPVKESDQATKIKQAIKNREIIVGMTLQDIDGMADGPGFLNGDDGTTKRYTWGIKLRSDLDPAKVILFNVHGDIEDGKLVAYSKSMVQ